MPVASLMVWQPPGARAVPQDCESLSPLEPIAVARAIVDTLVLHRAPTKALATHLSWTRPQMGTAAGT